MFASLMNSLCFCTSPKEKKSTIKIVNENTIIENNNNEQNKKYCSIYKENEFKNLKNMNSISTNTSKPHSTLSSTIQYGINSGSNIDKKNEKYKNIRKYIRNPTKKINKTIKEIYDEFLLKVDFIMEECKERETISESDDYESKKE